MKKLSLFLVALVMIIPSILFNAWCLQCVYELGLVPILSTFNIIMPTIQFSIFVVIVAMISAMHTTQGSKTYNNAPELVAGWLGVIITKLCSIGMLYIVNLIVF